MKEIVNFFAGRRYSAVHTSEMQVMGGNQKTQKSLKSKPTLDRGLSVIDALFHERKSGKRTRLPKSKCLHKIVDVNCLIENYSLYLRKKCPSVSSDHLNSRIKSKPELLPSRLISNCRAKNISKHLTVKTWSNL